MKVNGKVVPIQTGGKWHYWPFESGGTYHLEIQGTLIDQPKFQIRVGTAGARGVDPAKCRAK